MSDRVLYAKESAVTAEEFRDVLIASGMGTTRPVSDLERLRRMLESATFVVTARLSGDANKLVGIARGLCDGAWCCYVSELAVARDVQHAGIGRGILEHARAVLGPEISLILVSVPEAVGFYERAEMTPLPNCFWYKRQR